MSVEHYDEADFVRTLDADGQVVGDVPDLSEDRLLAVYRDMKLTRHFDERMVSLQRQGRVGTYAPAVGQEASQVGSTHALRDDDWLVYQYREHGAVAVRGLSAEYLTYWMGHEHGNASLVDQHVAPLNITIADQIPHAVGLAWGAKLKGDDTVVVCHFGDGATSEGDFHEAANFAGVFETPCVLFCNNNGWAISHPAERQTASETFAEKADAYGFPGVRVDGMDPLATYRVTQEAVERARNGGGPTLVEAVQYRYGAHTTADDPTAYREEETVEQWRERDPLDRYETFLRERDIVDDTVVEELEAEARETVSAIIDAAESFDPDPREMFDHAFADSTPGIDAQRESFDRALEEHGRDSFLRE
ncbi:pyruvate dehydrogenase (acetyl-transferring) E1 component subunit alpha [Salinigranum halophilum]|uniref:pyruvate dehydrogenase (acetyl-transferring) E1 component subunit alpha n=1 Tax=Salinigranum halophilum TaxID=2565931 RepID=UPI003742E7CC